MSLGLKNNKEINYLNAQLTLQIMALNEQYRKFFPQVGISYSDYAYVYYNSPDSRDKAVSFSMSQLVYDGNKLGFQIEDAKNNISLNSLANYQKRIDFIYQVISSYLSILKQGENINLKNQLLESQKKELNITQKKFELGEATKLDVLQWQIEYNQSVIDKKEIENSLQFDKMNFNKILGIDVEQVFEPAEKLDMNAITYFQDYDEKSIFENVIANSTDLKKIQFTINKTKALSIRQNMFIPEVTMNFSYSTKVDRMFRPDSSWNAGINLSIPFFFDQINLQSGLGASGSNSTKSINNGASTTVYQDPGFTRKIYEENISLDSLVYQYHQKMDELKLLVKKNISDIHFQKEKIDMLDEKIKLAEGQNVILARQVQVGEARLSEYIKAQTSLSGMRVDRVESIYNYTTLIIGLLKIQGRLSESDIKDFYKDFLKGVNNDQK